MSTSIAAYYTDELNGWNESIDFYNEEMDGMEQRLIDVIRRNNIAGIAAKVEAHQNMLNQSSNKFFRLQLEIQKQEARLKTDNTLIEDEAVDTETEKLQQQLRKQMQETEKEYIETKFNCYNFLSEIFKK